MAVLTTMPAGGLFNGLQYDNLQELIRSISGNYCTSISHISSQIYKCKKRHFQAFLPFFVIVLPKPTALLLLPPPFYDFLNLHAPFIITPFYDFSGKSTPQPSAHTFLLE
jgi:hypothetical protein